MIRIYTDGACNGNGTNHAKASCAFVVVDEKNQVVCSEAKLIKGKQSNNTAELYGIFEAMKWAEDQRESSCVIFSDSQYAINSITKWNVEKRIKGDKKANYDLIKEIQTFSMMADCDFEIVWVRGHADNLFNRLADEAAVAQLYS